MMLCASAEASEFFYVLWSILKASEAPFLRDGEQPNPWTRPNAENSAWNPTRSFSHYIQTYLQGDLIRCT